MSFVLKTFDFTTAKTTHDDGCVVLSWAPIEKVGSGGIVLSGKTIEEVEEKFKMASKVYEIVANILKANEELTLNAK